MSAEGLVQLSDEAKAYLWTVYAGHVPALCGWCRAGGCAERRRVAVELAMGGELDVPAPWTVRPEPGRWP
jgi:hypothetical protein